MAPKKFRVAKDQVGFDTFEASFVAPPKARRPSAKKVGTDDLDLARRPQTRLKLNSLDRYLPVWFGVIGNRDEPDALYLDLFAGAGVYQDGASIAKGSPVLACEAALDAVKLQAARSRTWTPHLRFVEESKEAAAKLGEVLEPFRGLVDFEVIESTAAAALPRLLRESARSPTLAFFDPFGYDIDYAWIEAFNRTGLNEVLVSFDAQGIKRNIAAGQTQGVTAFAGGDWWQDHLVDGELDLDEFLYALTVRLRRSFRYAGVMQFKFLSSHAYRAIAQVCGSVKGRRALLAAVKKSRDEMELVSDIFPDLDARAAVDEILERLRSFIGKSVIRKEIIGRIDDLEWSDEVLDQALCFLAEGGYLAWSDRTAQAGHPYRLYRFSRAWPQGHAWDEVEREVPPRPASALATSAR